MELNTIIKVVLKHTGINRSAVFMPTRKREIVQARQLIHYFAHEFTKLSLTGIGNRTGKNHATVIHSIRTIKNDELTDRQTENLVFFIRKELKEIQSQIPAEKPEKINLVNILKSRHHEVFV